MNFDSTDEAMNILHRAKDKVEMSIFYGQDKERFGALQQARDSLERAVDHLWITRD